MKNFLFILGIISLLFIACEKETICLEQECPLSEMAILAMNGELCTVNGEQVFVEINTDPKHGEIDYYEIYFVIQFNGEIKPILTDSVFLCVDVTRVSYEVVH